MKNYCQEYQVELNKENFLGKGMFSKAYKIGERVILVSEDNAKECLALFCQIENKHIPKCSRLDDIGEKSGYEMPYYKPLRSRESIQAWKDYKTISKCIDNIGFQERGKYVCFEGYRKAFEACQGLSEELKEALNCLVSEMQNYCDEIFVEISPRNAKVDEKGNLILLDIIGETESLRKKRKF